MTDAGLWVLAVMAVVGFAGWGARARLAVLLRSPSPRVLRMCRLVGAVARSVCGIASLVLIWAGLFAPGVAWQYAFLGVAVLALNSLLFLGRGKPR